MNRYKVLEKFESNKDFYDTVVQSGIEKHRKGNMRVKISGAAGAKVKIKQINHEFKFGANIFMLDEFESEEKNELYKEHFKEAFNMATLPFYWKDTEPQRGFLRYDKDSPKIYRRPAIDLCMEYCEKNGIEPREHALAYEMHFPDWIRNASVDEIKSALENRYEQIASRYASKIRTIEVTNEMFWHNGKTAFYNERDFIEWCFKLAQKHFPNNQLVINEATYEAWVDVLRPTHRYYSYIESALLKGCKIDAIGLQFHMFYDREAEVKMGENLYDPVYLYQRMQLLSSLVDTLQITEVTLPAYSNDEADEMIQAKLLEYLYSLWFSFPACEQIIYWNLVDGYAYVPDATPEKIRESQGNMSLGENVYYGGLLRFDMTPKPAFYALKNLVKTVWHTELEAKVGNDDCIDFRGFYGDYELTFEIDGKIYTKQISLSKNGAKSLHIEL